MRCCWSSKPKPPIRTYAGEAARQQQRRLHCRVAAGDDLWDFWPYVRAPRRKLQCTRPNCICVGRLADTHMLAWLSGPSGGYISSAIIPDDELMCDALHCSRSARLHPCLLHSANVRVCARARTLSQTVCVIYVIVSGTRALEHVVSQHSHTHTHTRTSTHTHTPIYSGKVFASAEFSAYVKASCIATL